MAIQYLSGVCAYLQVLDISNCHLITDKSLKYLRKGCKYLKKLVILNCVGINKDSIMKIKSRIAEVEYSNNGYLVESTYF
jgi:F-box/leucine-rich repeat protein 13